MEQFFVMHLKYQMLNVAYA